MKRELEDSERERERLQWLWVGVSEETTVYAIQPGRGFEEATHLLGPDFDGVLIRDGWAPYRRFTRVTHQTCLAHLLRRGRTLCRDHSRSRIAAHIHALLKASPRLRDDARAGELSRDDLGEALAALTARLARRLLYPPLGRHRPAGRSVRRCAACSSTASRV